MNSNASSFAALQISQPLGGSTSCRKDCEQEHRQKNQWLAAIYVTKLRQYDQKAYNDISESRFLWA